MKKKLYIFIGLFILTISFSNAQKIKIVRELDAGKCIFGQIFVNEKLVCYSLELPNIGNINNISSIPAGTYSAIIRTDGNMGWRIELKNVSDRSYIQIHKGNSTSSTTGCIIVCTTFDESSCTIPAGSSTKAMESLNNALYDAKIADNSSLTVVVENNIKKAENSFTDSRDGKTYKIVKIGNQTWMAENLNYSTGNSWCYDNSSSNCSKYGRLYDWNTAKKACPSGWHLPSKSEFETLLSKVGGSGNNAYYKDGGNSGFNALLGGVRSLDGSFSEIGGGGYWWSSSELDGIAWCMRMGGSRVDIIYMNSINGKSGGFSVRCLQD